MIVPGPDSRWCRWLRCATYAWIALLVLSLDPRTEDPATPIKQLATGVLASGVVLAWVIGLWMKRVPYRTMGHTLSCIPLLVGVLSISAACSDASFRGLSALAPWVTCGAIGFVAYQTFPHTHHLRTLFRAIVLIVALSSVYGLAQHFGWDPFPWALRDVEEYRALPATYGNPNLAGHALVVALVLWAGLLADAWQRRQWPLLWVSLPPGLLMITHLSLTEMRSGPVSLGMALAFVATTLILLRRTSAPWRAAGMALSICGGLLGLAAVVALLLAPMLGLDSSLQLRLNGYAGAAALFLENPIFGVGPGNYAFQNIPHWSDFEALWYALEGKRNFHVHNEWLEMAAECGVPGLAALIALFLFSIVTFFENPWLAAEKHWGLLLALPAAMVAMATDACFGFNLHAPVSAGLFFLLLGLGPARPHYSAPTRRSALRGTIPLCAATLVASWILCSNYRYERAFHAVAQMDDTGRVSDTLKALTESRPLDYRGWMLLGKWALKRGDGMQAAEAYGRALWVHPHLPLLHVERARALIRMAQEEHLETALTLAEKHANIALTRCPELAEAHAMLGWAAYVRSTFSGSAPSDADLRAAVEHFQRARTLGLKGDTNIDAALGDAHGRLGAWGEAAICFQRCVAGQSYDLKRWMQWRDAATRADGTALVAFRQALLHHLAPSNQGKLPLSPDLASWTASQIVTTAKSPAEAAVAERALEDVSITRLDETGIWSARLALVPEEARAETLVHMVESVPESRRTEIAPAIAVLKEAVMAPEAEALTRAASTLASGLATAPGAEDFERALVYAPLAKLLEDSLRDAGLPDTTLPSAFRDLGAVQFETGNLQGADASLRAAEAALSAAELPAAWYYHARVLSALGRQDAALAMAQAAQGAAGGVVEYQWQLARCLAAAGKSEAARFAFESLLGSLPPDHPYRALVERDLGTLPAGGTSQ